MIRRLLADADLNGAIVSGVMRRSGDIDFKRAEHVPLEGLPDLAVLAAAAKDRRVLVSHDVSTMPGHFFEYVRRHVSPGLILLPQSLGIGTAIENILLLSDAFDPRDIENRVCLMPSFALYGFAISTGKPTT